MPKVDFSKVDDVQDFTPLPEGKYLCRLNGIEEATTQYGDDLWKLRFEVAEGEHAGRYIFDNMVFSQAAMKRVKLICSRLGLDVSGELDLTPKLLIGRTALVETQIEEYEDSEGRKKKRNVVPFAGYEHAEAEQAAGESSNEENEFGPLPF
ncbi:MAG TPA: DUF669 domain-containing protein [Firmicutes bacterium]|nr:DUF669 domain-containing protein [Bacillota bacterium]